MNNHRGLKGRHNIAQAARPGAEGTTLRSTGPQRNGADGGPSLELLWKKYGIGSLTRDLAIFDSPSLTPFSYFLSSRGLAISLNILYLYS
jgi:hypothetical protein